MWAFIYDVVVSLTTPASLILKYLINKPCLHSGYIVHRFLSLAPMPVLSHFFPELGVSRQGNILEDWLVGQQVGGDNRIPGPSWG